MRKLVIFFAIASLGVILSSESTLAAQPVSGSDKTSASSTAPGAQNGTVKGRRNGKNTHHFRHKNRSMEPADDNTGAIPNKTPAHGNIGKNDKATGQ
jgi:hypothetical protein